MEKNVDKLKHLERELGRFRKKAEDQNKELRRLKASLEEANTGSQQTQSAMDAILTALALQYGQKVTNPEQPDLVLGFRLHIPACNIPELRNHYEVHARRDHETDGYVVGVVPRQKDEEPLCK